MLTGSSEDRALAAASHQEKHSAVRRSTRKDKRNYTESLAHEAQDAAKRGDSRTVHKITKALTRGFVNSTTVVKDKDGNTLLKNKDQLQRWAVHFQDVLNRPDPEEEAIVEDTDFHTEMKRGRNEIEEAIRQTKGNRAPGEDMITADMFKVGMQEVHRLTG